MTALQIAAIYIAANILILLWLATRVVGHRLKSRVSMGDGGSEDLAIAIRVHGNAAEYIPGVLVGLLAVALICPIEMTWPLHAIGGTFTLARVLHAIGLSRTVLPLRQTGILLSWASMLGLVVALVWLALG